MFNNNAPQAVQVPYLRTSRPFPDEVEELPRELTKMYAEVASTINRRTIGIYNTFKAATGNQYYNALFEPLNQTTYRQSYRQVYPFGPLAAGATALIAHGISGITQAVSIYGTAVTIDVVNGKYIPLPFVSTINTNQCVSVSADDTNIYVINGPAADNIISGCIIFEILLT